MALLHWNSNFQDFKIAGNSCLHESNPGKISSTELLNQASIQDWKEQDRSCTSALCVGQVPSTVQWPTAPIIPLTEHGSKGSGKLVCATMTAKSLPIALPGTSYLLIKNQTITITKCPPSISSVLLYMLHNELSASDLHAKPCKMFVKYSVCSSGPISGMFLTNTFLPDFMKKANIVWKMFSFSWGTTQGLWFLWKEQLPLSWPTCMHNYKSQLLFQIN